MRTISIILLLFPLLAHADDWGPWEITPKPQKQMLHATNKVSPLQPLVRFFQRYISPVDGPRCPMYPTCSTYALQALDKHGPLLGVFLTVDRLYREIDPNEHQQPITKGGYIRFDDPLTKNDFWLNPTAQN